MLPAEKELKGEFQPKAQVTAYFRGEALKSHAVSKPDRVWLYALIVANAVVVLSVSLYLGLAYRTAEQEARRGVSNLVSLVRSELDVMIGEMDMALRALSEEPVSGKDSEARRLKLINRVAQDDPQFRTLVVMDADGQFVGGKLASDGKPFNAVGRDYFNYLKQNPEPGMLVGGPFVGRSNGKWSLVFARRLNRPDGRFAGVVLSGYAVERFAEAFSKIDLNSFNAIALLKADRTMLVFHPENSRFGPGKEIPVELAAALDADPEKGMIDRMGDGSASNPRRIAAYERTSDQRFYVVASIRLEQVFAGVYRQILVLLSVVVLIVALSVYFARRTLRAEASLHEYQHHLEAMVDARTEALTVAKDAAEAADRAKRIFLANISHELRTPMNSIMGFTEIVKRHLSDPRDKEYLGTVQGSAKALLNLIQNLIDLSRIESDRLDLDDEIFSMNEVLQGVVEVVAPLAKAKGISFHADIAPAFAAVTLRGDALRIGQVMLNLAENAVKFTHAGEISIAAVVEAETADTMQVGFCVRDTGIGISESDRARLFSAFEQVDGSMTRKFGGTGIGLALCKRLAERMGGSVDVASEPGRGSEFTLHLKVAKAGSAPAVGA